MEYIPPNIRTDTLPTIGSPNSLLTNRRTSPSSINHQLIIDKDTDMSNLVLAITTSSPEQEITGLSLRTWIPLAHTGVILVLRNTGNRLLQCLADSILRQTGAVKAAAGGTLATTTAPDVWEAFLFLGCSDDGFSGAFAASAVIAATTAAAFGGHVAAAAGFHVVVGYVAAVRCLVPDVVAGDYVSSGLAGNLDILGLFV